MLCSSFNDPSFLPAARGDHRQVSGGSSFYVRVAVIGEVSGLVHGCCGFQVPWVMKSREKVIGQINTKQPKQGGGYSVGNELVENC